MAHLVIVTGLPASGKTTLGRRLAADLDLPFISKDDIKEALFESIGWKDRPWSQKMGFAAYAVLYRVIAMEGAAGTSVMVESNFDPSYSGAPLNDLVERYRFLPVQILCHARGDVLVQRYVERDRAGVRHPGHVDAIAYQDILPRLREGRIVPLPLVGPLIEVDTSVPDAIDYGNVLRRVRNAVADRDE